MTGEQLRKLSSYALLKTFEGALLPSRLPAGRFVGRTWPLSTWPLWRGKVFDGTKVKNLIGPRTMIEGYVTLEDRDVVITYKHGLLDVLRPVTDSLWLGQFILGGVTIWFTLERDLPETIGVWQPIETAPEDGTTVLVFCPTDPEYNQVYAARYANWHWGSDPAFEPLSPTHWMPLPRKPASSPPCGPTKA